MKTTRTHWLIGLLALQPMLLQAQQESAPQPLALSLRDAVRMALAPKGNLAIDVAAESVMYAEAQLSQARTANRPDIEFSFVGQNQLISLDAQGLQSVHLPGFTFPQTAGPYSILDARFRVRQSFLDFASNRRTDVARAGIETAKTETDQVREQIAARVARLYLAAKRAATAVDTARSLVATAESALKEVTDRSGADKALPIDVAHARVQVGTQKQHLMQAELERDRAAMELLSAVNRDLNTPLNLTDPLAYAAEQTPAALQSVATALSTRGEIQSERKRIEAARMNDVAIHSERLPSIAGFADMGSIGTSIPNSTGTYDVGVSLRIPVFDSGRRNFRRAEIAASIRQEELRIAQLQKQIEFEVRQALLKLDMARGQVENAEAEVEMARQELEHRKRRVEGGVGVEPELTDAQIALTKAADARVAALYAWNDAHIELMQAMGTVHTLAQ